MNVEYGKPEYPVALHCLFDNQNPFKVYVSLTGNPNDSVRFPGYHGQVTISENGVDKGVLLYDSTEGAFISNWIPTTGNLYYLYWTGSRGQAALGKNQLPPTLQIGNLSLIDSFAQDAQGNYLSELKFSFKDIPGTSKYALNIKYYNIFSGLFEKFTLTTQDWILNGRFAKKDKNIYYFDDGLFKDQVHTFVLRFPSGVYLMPNGKTRLLVELTTMGEDYIRYAESIEKFHESGTGGVFRDPVQVYSNIDKGYGIFAGASISRDTIN